MEKFTNFCLKFKWLILGIYFIIVLGFLYQVVGRILSNESVIDNSVGVWFMQDDPELIHYDKYNEDFGQQEWSILLIKTKSIYNAEFLKELNQISERIGKLNHVIKVTSIANVRDNEIKDDALNYEKIFPGDSDKLINNEELNIFKSKLNKNLTFHNSLFKPGDESSTVVLIQNDNLIRSLEPYRIQLIDSVELILKDYKTISEHSLAGTTVVNAELNRAARHDAVVFYGLITIMITAFGWFALRRVKDIIVMFSVIIGSIIPTMGALALLKIPYNMVTLMMPTILVAISVSDVIHLISDFHLEKRHHGSKASIHEAIAAVWKPGLWTSFGTIVGFISLASSTVYPIFQLGVFICVGVTLAWIATMTIAPVLLMLFYPESLIYKVHTIKEGKPYTEKLIPLVEKYKPLWIGIAIIILLPSLGITRIDVDTNYTKFFSESTNISKSYDRVKANGFAQNPVNITIDYPKGKDYTSEGYFSNIVKFEEELTKLPEVIKLLSVTDLVRQIDKAYVGDSAAEQRFVKYKPEQISQLLLLGEMSDNDDIYDFITYEKDKAQIVAMTDYMSSKELDRFKEKVQTLKAKYLNPDLKVQITGSTVLWANMDKQISHTQVFSVWGTVIFLIIFFPIIFRSWQLSVIAFVLNALPILITYGIMGLLDIKINLATALIGGIALGIASDDTIHTLSRFKYALANGKTWDEAVDYAVINCGHSVIMTSVILIGGFFCMFTSDFLPISHFGILVSWCIFIAVYFDLFILPIVLRMMKPRKYRQAPVVKVAEESVVVS